MKNHAISTIMIRERTTCCWLWFSWGEPCSYFLLAFFGCPVVLLSSYVPRVDQRPSSVSHLHSAKRELTVKHVIFTFRPFLTIFLANVDKPNGSCWGSTEFVRGRHILKSRSVVDSQLSFTASGYVAPSLLTKRVHGHQDEAGIEVNFVLGVMTPSLSFVWHFVIRFSVRAVDVVPPVADQFLLLEDASDGTKKGVLCGTSHTCKKQRTCACESI